MEQYRSVPTKFFHLVSLGQVDFKAICKYYLQRLKGALHVSLCVLKYHLIAIRVYGPVFQHTRPSNIGLLCTD